MTRILNYFLRGLVIVAPLAVTIWVCVTIFETIDSWLGLAIPGAGFVISLVLITLIGFLASSILARAIGDEFDKLLNRLPFVRLLYSSAKDMLNAFVGEKRRFDKPVLVSLTSDGSVKIVGFLTADSLASLGAANYATVYMPQSYGFAGHILIVKSSQVTRIDADAPEVMAFIISGGVTEIEPR